jgi:hypothetical protein
VLDEIFVYPGIIEPWVNLSRKDLLINFVLNFLLDDSVRVPGFQVPNGITGEIFSYYMVVFSKFSGQ